LNKILIFDKKIHFYFLNMFMCMTFEVYFRTFSHLMSSLFKNLKKLILKTYSPQSRSFDRQICAQTQDLQSFKKFYMSQMNPKEVFHSTAYSVQLPYIAGHSLLKETEFVYRRETNFCRAYYPDYNALTFLLCGVQYYYQFCT